MIPALVSIVEGKSEVEALRGLLERIIFEIAGKTGVRIATPFLVKRGRVVKEDRLEAAIDAATRDREEKGFQVAAVIVLLDADDDCPVQLARELNGRARSATIFPVSVVLADKAIESWPLTVKESLQGVCGIRNDATAPAEPERIRYPKDHLSRNMEEKRSYIATHDLPVLLRKMSIPSCEEHNRSFRKFVKEVKALVERMERP